MKLPFVDSWQSDSFARFPEQGVRFRNLMVIAQKTFPDYTLFFSSSASNTSYISQAKSVIEHLLKILAIEKQSCILTKDMKIFDSADEKMKQSGLCFQNGDYSSLFHSLNTALELVLKDKLNIPSKITNINTSNIVDILVKYKIEPYRYLTEAKKYVITIDNKIKHQGYAPSKIDSINAIKAMEELIGKLRGTDIEIVDEVRDKIFEGI